MTLCIGIALAYLVAAVSPTLAVANAALPSYVVTLLFFTGGTASPWLQTYPSSDGCHAGQ